MTAGGRADIVVNKSIVPCIAFKVFFVIGWMLLQGSRAISGRFLPLLYATREFNDCSRDRGVMGVGCIHFSG